MELAGVGKFAQRRGLHIHFFAERQKFGKLVWRNGQGHPFLGLGQEDFPRLKARVFQGRLVQVQFKPACIPAHFPD